MKKLTYLFYAILLVCSSNVFASTINVSDVDGGWQNSIPSVTITNGDPTSTASWGTSTGYGRSSYVFTALIPPPQSVVLPPSPSAWIQLGNFTHNNMPVTGTSLDSIDLSLTIDFTIDGSVFNKTFIYSFDHTETPNSGSDPRDIVKINPPSSGVFSLDGVLYTLELSFWLNNSPTGTFYTNENASNIAAIYGRFTSENTPVPEPISMILFGTGIVGVGGYIRRKLKK
jgi:hypothetical protein